MNSLVFSNVGDICAIVSYSDNSDAAIIARQGTAWKIAPKRGRWAHAGLLQRKAGSPHPLIVELANGPGTESRNGIKNSGWREGSPVVNLRRDQDIGPAETIRCSWGRRTQ